METNQAQKPEYIEHQENNNCQQFYGPISGCVFAMPGSTVNMQAPQPKQEPMEPISKKEIDDFIKKAAQAVEDSRRIFESVDNIDLQPGTVRPLSSAYLQEQFYQYSQRTAEDVSMADDDIWRTIYKQEKEALTLLDGCKPHGEIFNTLLELQSDLLERMLKDHTCLNEWVEARSKGYPKEKDYEEVIKWLAYQKTRGNDYYAMNDNNRTKMCKELTKKFGWDVDQNSLQQHERRQLEKRKMKKNNN